MRLLLDTHAFLFAIREPESLSAKARRLLENTGVERWVSVVTLWEIATKVAIGKLSAPLERTYYTQHLQALQAKTLAVTWSTRWRFWECRFIIAMRSTAC